ncbi:MAG: phage tail tape measure protein [Eubacteriales bacterium]|nr:phage tail tape measure protein [Eubacteriales bacterium]
MGADGHVRIEISGDSTPLEKDLQRVEKEADDSMSAVKEGAQKAEDALNDMGEAARGACDSKVTGGLEDVADALADVGDNAGDAGKGVEDTGKKAESVWKKLEGMSESAADLQDALANTVKQSASTIGKTFAVVGAGVTAVGAATAGVLVNLGNGYNKAVNQISAATGATGKELEQLGQIAQNVYSHNFGDSLEDVADGISVVRQNTQLMGEELQAATEAGFALRDTFGYDLSESARTASALMKNFGIDANKAYNIIATGAQKGADQNGDLLDTLNEYSTQYAALGLYADQFVNGLIAGAEAGVFSIDKVGDAVKEFNIRAKDGSKSTTSAFATLGLKASTTMQAFAKGGDTAQKAFFEVVKALEAMKDPVEKNQTAVALFGTQYEDLEKTVLPVLASMEDASKTTYDALGEINEIKYKDLGSALGGLKRTIEGALIPSASKIASGPMMTAMQELQRMANDLAKSIKAGEYDSVFAGIADGITGVIRMLPKIRDGIRKIAPVVSNIAGITMDFLSVAVDNIDLVISAIVGVSTAIAGLKLLTFIGDVTQAVKTLTAAFSLSAGPIGLAVVAIGALAAVITDVAISGDSASDILRDNTEATQKLREESEKLTEECERNREERQKNADAAETETAMAEEYAKKLSELAGKENKSASEKKKMAKYVEKLNDLVPNLSLKYDEEKDQLNKSTDAIYRNIDALKEQAKVKAYTENYESAVKEQAEVEKKLNDARVQYHKNLEELDRAQRKLNAVSPADQPALYDNLSAKVNIAKKNVEESKKAFDDLSDSFHQSSSDMDYWGKKMEEETDAQAVVDNLNKLADVAEEAGIKLPKSVSDGVKSGKYQMAESVDELKRLIDFDAAIQKAGLQGVEIPQSLSAGVNSGQISVTEAIQRLKDIAKFDGIARNAGLSGNKATQKLRDSIANGSVSVSEAANRVAAAVKFDKAAEAAGLSGNKTIGKLRDSMLSGETTIAAAAEQIANLCVNNMTPEGAEAEGEKAMNELASGYKNGGAIAERAAKSVSDGSLDELRVAASQSGGVGYNVSDGFASGITLGKWKAINAIIDLVDDTLSAGKKEAGIASPSKVMRDQVGIHMASGMAVGIRKGIPQAASAAADMVSDTVDAANAAAAKAKIDTSKLTLSPAEAQAAIAANIDSMSAQAKLAVQYEMDRRAASVAAQTAAAPTYNDSQVVGLLHQLLVETKAGKVIRVNQRELGRTVQQWERRMSNVTGGM